MRNPKDGLTQAAGDSNQKVSVLPHPLTGQVARVAVNAYWMNGWYMYEWLDHSSLLDLTGITTVINHHLKLLIHRESEFMHIPPEISDSSQAGLWTYKDYGGPNLQECRWKRRKKIIP